MEQPKRVARPDEVSEVIFAGAGQVRALLRSFDWAKTSLGDPSTWPQSLTAALSLCLDSRFPMLVWWGDDLTLFYNDAALPFFGRKHPGALGSPGLSAPAFGVPEMRAVTEPMLRSVMERGEAAWSEDQMVIFERNGFREELYVTWSYSPIRVEAGRVRGVFTAAAETTAKVLADRRTRVLRALTARAGAAKTAESACARASEALGAEPRDLPFHLLYTVSGDGAGITLQGRAGLQDGHPAAPVRIARAASEASWPLRAAESGPVEVDLSTLGWNDRAPILNLAAERVRRAMVLPLRRPGEGALDGFLIAGTNPRLSLDEPYRAYLAFVAELIAGAVANARDHDAHSETTRAPLASVQPISPATLAPPAPAHAANDARRVLVVEDNDDARDMLKELLEELGHAVDVARDGPEGLRKLLSLRPDIAFIDIGLPGIDGHELARRARSAPEGTSSYLVALTGYGGLEARTQAEQAGFDQHVVKPIDIDALPGLIEQINKRSRTNR
jgi:CheY-like chemotaxis protein